MAADRGHRVLRLVPALIAVHNAEEAIAFRHYLPIVHDRLPGALADSFAVTYPQILIALVIATAIPAGVILWALSEPHVRSKLWIALLIQMVVLLNVLSHVCAALFIMHGYSPGLITALVLNLPFSIHVFREARRAHWVTRRQLLWLVPAAVVVHGPLLIGLILLSADLAR
jgi:hypothetical protein